MVVSLNTFYPVDSDQVRNIEAADLDGTPVIETAEPGLHLGGELRHGNKHVDVSIDLIDMNSTLWTPTITEGHRQSDELGIVIAEKAANDLGVEVGDTITVEHPYRVDDTTYIMRETDMKVIGIHANPMRYLSYMDIQRADTMGLQGMTNMLNVHPADHFSQSDVQRAMFDQPGVASVRAVSAFTKMLKDMMGLLIGFMSIVAGAVMVLAFLIAFNSTSINVDERAREIATMFAFGLPIRTVTRMTMQENLITGILATLLGIVLGYLTTVWMMQGRVENMMPDVIIHATLAPLSLALAVIVGVVVVALTPLLSIRKMSRMNLPSTLRVME
jgi:putative ABC transport system permease protein